MSTDTIKRNPDIIKSDPIPPSGSDLILSFASFSLQESTSSETLPTNSPFTPLDENFTPEADSPSFKFNDNSFSNQTGVCSNCLWVGNVCPKLSKEEFKKVFLPFGKVLLVRMFSKSKCAFVTFASAKSALKALALEGKMLGSMRLTMNVGMASRHLWVGNVAQNITEQDIYMAFSVFGVVESVRILRANKCAFVNFTTETAALTAAEKMSTKKLGGEEIIINFQWRDAYRKSSKGNRRIIWQGQEDNSDFPEAEHVSLVVREFSMPSRQLFVGNISQSVSEDMLWTIFSPFGDINTIKRFGDRGYAFVIFKNLNDSIWAREQMAMYPPLINGRLIAVNFGRILPVNENPGQKNDEKIDNTNTYSSPYPTYPNPKASFYGSTTKADTKMKHAIQQPYYLVTQQEMEQQAQAQILETQQSLEQ